MLTAIHPLYVAIRQLYVNLYIILYVHLYEGYTKAVRRLYAFTKRLYAYTARALNDVTITTFYNFQVLAACMHEPVCRL